MSLKGTFVSRDAFGQVRFSADIEGEPNYIATKLGMIVEGFAADSEPGDVIVMQVCREIPTDHPLAGIDLA